MADPTIRPARDEDVPAILDILRAALGESPMLRRTPELWSWKHLSNPFGGSLVFVAESRGRIAGVRAMMRWRLITQNGHALSCLRPVDTATHPAFARQGIFRRLTMTALDAARAEGVHLIFNTPNDRSGPGYLKMGWGEVGRIGVLARPRVGPSVRPDPAHAPAIEDWVPHAGKVPASSLDEDRRPRGLRTPRSAGYRTWRFLAHPFASYGWVPAGSTSGVIVRAGARSGRSELVVSDLVGSPGATPIRALARASRARYLAAWFSKGSPERRVALNAGLVPVPGLRPLQLIALPLRDFDVDVHDLSSWDLATSDLELL